LDIPYRLAKPIHLGKYQLYKVPNLRYLNLQRSNQAQSASSQKSLEDNSTLLCIFHHHLDLLFLLDRKYLLSTFRLLEDY
jgi:hypothetical protein